MPFLDGYEATKQIRQMFLRQNIEREKQPRIIAITGHVENEYVQKAVECGMDKVYQKPLSIKELGFLLMNLGFIDGIPPNCKLDSHEN